MLYRLYTASYSVIGSPEGPSATYIHRTDSNLSMFVALDQFRLVSRLPSNRLPGRAVALNDIFSCNRLLALFADLPT